MILVVVTMEAVATARLEILELSKVSLDRRNRFFVLRVVHRVRLRNEHLHAVDDLARVDQPDPSEFLGRKLYSLLIRHVPDLVPLEAEVFDAEARLAGANHAVTPGAVVLNAARARL